MLILREKTFLLESTFSLLLEPFHLDKIVTHFCNFSGSKTCFTNEKWAGERTSLGDMPKARQSATPVNLEFNHIKHS